MVKDSTTAQIYNDAGIVDFSVTTAKIVFKNTMDDSEYEIDILANWDYLLGCDGLTINIIDFPDLLMSNYKYFPDGVYETTVVYTYQGIEYSDLSTTGFKYLIDKVIAQQLLQSNWKKELHCDCNCKKYSTSIRKFNWFMMLGYAAGKCLYTEYMRILRALYKLTGEKYEFTE